MVARRFAPAALALMVAGCAQMGGSASAPPTASQRFAVALEDADQAVEAAIQRLDGFERLALREEAAISYAAGGTRSSAGFNPMAAGVAETAGDALDPAFTALSDYAHILGQVAGGQPISAKPSPSGEVLATAVGTALDRLSATGRLNIPAGTRQAGLTGIAALADLPETLAKRGGTPTLGAVVAEADPHVKAVTALLRLVIGPEAGTGTRAVIRARRESLDAQHRRFLEAVRRDSRIGAGERYAIFRSVAELRDTDPAAGTLAAIVTLLNALDQAHSALALDAEDANVKVAGFEAAVARLGALTEASRRG